MQNILDATFVKQSQEKIELGAETSQSDMLQRQTSKDADISGQILLEISKVLFSNATRYIQMQPEDLKKDDEAQPMYESVQNLSETEYNDFNEIPKDLATYINANGGR